MRPDVFISYAHDAGSAEANALALTLGEAAFLDETTIEDGEEFPPRLIEALLDARVVVVFATSAYAKRLYCRLEVQIAIAACGPSTKQLVIALGDGAEEVLDAMPRDVAAVSWPKAKDTERLEVIVRRRLDGQPA